MHSIEETEHTPPAAARTRNRVQSSRIWTVLLLFLVLLLLALLPPLINLGRYQRRVATSISLSMGRPVHLDHVTLNLLPLPSLTLANLVVDEDPTFGDEPIIRANTVQATLRVVSLWRRRVEFSRISFADPSVNLVLRYDGRWNLEDVLLHAAHTDAAPTAQRRAGPAPRFPYIEATGARLNLKLGREKTPFSLTEADFALWLPQPQQWRMRLKAKPMRTDTSATDTGTVQMEATLDRAASLALVPLSVEVAWRKAPIGDAGRILFGRDLGLRGSAEIVGSAHGTLSASELVWRTSLSGLHRSDFVPDKTLSADVECSAEAREVFHALGNLRCIWSVPDSDGATIALTGAVPNLLHPATAEIQVGTGRLPAATLLDWLRVASRRIPTDVKATGLLSASLARATAAGGRPTWSGQATLSDVALASSRLGEDPFSVESLTLAVPRTAEPAPLRADLEPALLPLGGRDPALLEGSVDSNGYTLRLSGSIVPARLTAVAATLPQLADGLAAVLPRGRGQVPVHLDLSAYRPWAGPQVWTDHLASLPPPVTRKARRRGGHR